MLIQNNIKEIEIEKIEANPFRDFDCYPLDEDQINQLMTSITEREKVILDARPHPTKPNYFQLVWGHHRFETMRRLNYNTIRLDISHCSDTQMVKSMVRENIKQSGQVPATMLNDVCAIARIEIYNILRAETVEDYLSQCGIEDTARMAPRGAIQNAQAFAHLKNDLLKNKFLGYRSILNFMSGALSKRAVAETLDHIKAANLHTPIFEEVQRRLNEEAEIARLDALAKEDAKHKAEIAAEEKRVLLAEQQAILEEKRVAAKIAHEAHQNLIAKKAEEKLIQAQKDKEEKLKEVEIQQARKVQETQSLVENTATIVQNTTVNSEAATKKAIKSATIVTNVKEKSSPSKGKKIFDERIIALFKQATHVTAFRERVTQPKFLKVWPVEKQFSLALRLKDEKKKLTQIVITTWLDKVYELATNPAFNELHEMNEKTRQLEKKRVKVRHAAQEVQRGLKSLEINIGEFLTELQTWPREEPLLIENELMRDYSKLINDLIVMQRKFGVSKAYSLEENIPQITRRESNLNELEINYDN